jgi:hypothetical protein
MAGRLDAGMSNNHKPTDGDRVAFRIMLVLVLIVLCMFWATYENAVNRGF